MFDFLNPQSPKNQDQALLLLPGAMYVEENHILNAIDENVDPSLSSEDLKALLIEGYGSLDMNMEEYPDEDEMQSLLVDNWGIESKQDMYSVLDQLIKSGTNKTLTQMISFAKSSSDSTVKTISNYCEQFGETDPFPEMTETEFNKLLDQAIYFESKIGRGGVSGWDLARYSHLIRIGFIGDIISGKEGWTLLENLKEPMKKQFTGWNDFANSFMLGRKFWSGGGSVLDDACHRLLEHPRSPWKVLGWF